MRVLLLCALGVALGGCGVLDDEGPPLPKPRDPAVYGPAKAVAGAQPSVDAPRLVAPTPEVARALDDGAIGVVDVAGIVSIRPEALETASDLTLEGLAWTSWDRGGATATGKLRALTCQPTCASGGIDEVPARVSLSRVTTCDGRRYFGRGEVVVEADDQPATYVRAPC